MPAQPGVLPRLLKKGGVLRNFPVVRTQNPEHVREALMSTFGVLGFRTEDPAQRFHGQINYATLRATSIASCDYGSDVSIDYPATEYYRQQLCLAGHGTSFVNGEEIPLRPGKGCIIAPHVRLRSTYVGPYRQVILGFNPINLRSKLAKMIGMPVVDDLRFDNTVELNAAANRHHQSMIAVLIDILEGGASELHHIVVEEFEKTLMISLLCCHPHNYTHLLIVPVGMPAAWQLRRMEEFIEGNWHRAVTIEMISEAVGVSIRGVFRAFKENKGYSPMIYLKNVRLDRARDQLLSREPGITVSAVALRCGFQNLGHFAREYKRRFGELPSATIL